MAVARVITKRTEFDLVIAWALATFHASFFLLVILIFLYLVDVLRNVFAGLNTAVGLALFVLLWGVTFYTTRRALRAATDYGTFIHSAIKWGGLNGVLFLWAVIIPAFIALTLATGNLISAAIGIPLYGVIGSIVAYAVGSVIGFIFGILDLALLAVAQRLARPHVAEDVLGS